MDQKSKFCLTYREIYKKPGFHALCDIGTMPLSFSLKPVFFG